MLEYMGKKLRQELEKNELKLSILRLPRSR